MYIQLRDGSQLTVKYGMEIKSTSDKYYIIDGNSRKTLFEIPAISVLYVKYE